MGLKKKNALRVAKRPSDDKKSELFTRSLCGSALTLAYAAFATSVELESSQCIVVQGKIPFNVPMFGLHCAKCVWFFTF